MQCSLFVVLLCHSHPHEELVFVAVSGQLGLARKRVDSFEMDAAAVSGSLAVVHS